MNKRSIAILGVSIAVLIGAIVGFVSAQKNRVWYQLALEDVVSWGNTITDRGTLDRGCIRVGAEQIFDALSPHMQNEVVSVAELTRVLTTNSNSLNCLHESSLVQLQYDNLRKTVYGVWRCKAGEFTGEFQLALTRPTSGVPLEADCESAVFPTSLDIEIGAATEIEW